MPPTNSLRPMIPDNARTLRITAAAGTELAGASSVGTVIFRPYWQNFTPRRASRSRGVAASGFPPLRKIPYCCLP